MHFHSVSQDGNSRCAFLESIKSGIHRYNSNKQYMTSICYASIDTFIKVEGVAVADTWRNGGNVYLLRLKQVKKQLDILLISLDLCVFYE